MTLCVSQSCSLEATMFAPASYCDICWQNWWDCEDCTNEQDCSTHARETKEDDDD